MDRETELAVVRRAFAKQILAVFRVGTPRLEKAFSAVEKAFGEVRREDYLGPGPWPIFRLFQRYVPTPDDDPVYLYTDDLIGIAPERQINNGQPSLHAALISMVLPAAGEHVVHIGAGVGYYTAIMRELVGTAGRVTAIEYESDLAKRTAVNLNRYDNVQVIAGDGTTVTFDAADVIYVNAGATGPLANWLDRLRDGGRLMLPLTTDDNFSTTSLTPDFSKMALRGAIFRIGRTGNDYTANWLVPTAIYPCGGGRDPMENKALSAALERGGAQKVTRLYRTGDIPDERCWLRGKDWCLAYS